MKIERIAISKLTPDPNNARTHDQRNLDAIAGSLSEFGQRKPIVITQDNIIAAGNGTVEAAKSLGWTDIEVVRMPADWDADRIKAFALADNRTAELASWNPQVLNAQLMELVELDFNIKQIGFAMPQVLELEKQADEELPASPVNSVTKIGDVWQLGAHRLVCGDSLAPGVYAELLGEEKVDLVWTDPPYGVAIVGGNRSLTPEERKKKGGLEIKNDDLDLAGLESFLSDAFSIMLTNTKPGAVWYVAAPSGNLFHSFASPLLSLGVWKHTLVWVKDSLVMGRADYHYRHESIFYGWTPGGAHQTPPDRKQDTVWEVARPKVNKEHPTMKPIELIVKAINNSSRVKDLVLDPFGGSGSTLIACEQTKRTARIIELDPKYCDVIIQRWENLTGEKAELVNAGR
jgi:site-specific DNA-methyltransferase (adenine-specific)